MLSLELEIVSQVQHSHGCPRCVLRARLPRRGVGVAVQSAVAAELALCCYY
jgi:hypothetical protein